MDFNIDEWNVIKKEDGTEYLERKDINAMNKAAAESANMNEAFIISNEEIAADNLRALRHLRDQKLTETDWSQGADVPDALKTKYTTYRQALRDITKSYTSWADVVWPTKPE